VFQNHFLNKGFLTKIVAWPINSDYTLH